MKNARKSQKFVVAIRSLAYWSKELLKIIEWAEGKCDTRQREIGQDGKPQEESNDHSER